MTVPRNFIINVNVTNNFNVHKKIYNSTEAMRENEEAMVEIDNWKD